MEVVTDSVPSPPRSEQEQAFSDKEQDMGIPDPSSEQQNQTKSPESRQESATKPSSRSSPTHQEYSKANKRKSSSRTTSKNGTQNSVIFSGCSNVVFGNVNTFTYNPQSKDSTPMTAGIKTRVPKELRELRNSKKTVEETDIIIVSQSVDMDGLEILAKELGIEEVEFNKIKYNNRDKGVQEVATQTLKLWKDMSSRGQNQSAMLNILCEKVYHIYKNGGERALKSLYRKHFP